MATVYRGLVNTTKMVEGEDRHVVYAATMQEAQAEAAAKRWTVKAEILSLRGNRTTRVTRFVVEPDGTIVEPRKRTRQVR